MEIENIIEDWKIDSNSLDTYSDMENIIDIDYKKTHESIARAWYQKFIDVTKWIEQTGIVLWEYQSLYSPQYYNFSTDEINILVEYNEEKVREYLISNREKFSEYIKQHNTSYDGYMAYYSNDFDKYISGDFHEAQLTQVLDFYIEQNSENYYEKDIQMEIFDGISWDMYLEFTYITK